MGDGMFKECEDWELRVKLLESLKSKTKEQLLRDIEVILDFIEGKEVFESLLQLLK